MKVIGFVSQKGGSGKSTLAVHIAVAAEESKQRVAIVDTDPQKSVLTWSEQREAKTPVVVAAPGGEIAQVLDAARGDGMSLVVIDSAPHTDVDASRVASVSDLVIVPCRPAAFDLSAVAQTVEMIKALKREAVLVLSACPPRAPEIDEAREVLKGYGLPVYGGQITDRRAFARALVGGRSVTEFDSGSKAAEEIRALWKWIHRRMK